MRPLSLTARVSLLFATAVAAVLFGVGWLIASAVERHFIEMDQHALEGKLALVRNLLARAHGARDRQAVGQALRDALVGHHELTLVLLDARGAPWYVSDPTALHNRPPTATGPGLTTWQRAGRGYRGLQATVLTSDGQRLTAVLVLDISHHQHFFVQFRRDLAIAMTLAVLLTAALGWLAVHTGLRPLRQVTDLAANLSASRLDARLPATGLPPEIHRLAAAFNAMLERLQDAFHRLSQFSADLAHELRTPVCNLMTQTQVALSRPREARDYREVLASALEEYDRLARMIDDMLFLAKADHQLVVPRREAVDLGAEARRLAEFYGVWAEESGVTLAVSGQAHLQADRLMLQRALANLLANAIRHTPAGGEVRIELSQGPTEVHIAVDNPGPDIPPEHLPRLFDRYYRIDPADPGSHAGLGLAIVKSIAETHGGRVCVTSQAQHTRFEITLPLQHRAPR
ncbi:MAG: heavy metal sensor histidine kinase [Thiobacillaceae bacterium]|nr:heavy metal sensor histidine kinase [Thiobacillaceae bacterium]